ncbi:MAG TPA: Ig-like domain-containing protein [Gammaproteobacteria bacterium]
MAFDGNTYVAAGTGGVLYSSTDSVNWTQRRSGLPASFIYFDALYANGLFLAAGSDAAGASHISFSHDGITWSTRKPALLAGQAATHLGYGGGTYLAVGTVALASTDGKTWVKHKIEAAANFGVFQSPAYAGGTFVVMGTDVSAATVLFYSTDAGATWTPAATSIPDLHFIQSLATDGSGFVLTGVDLNAGCTACGIVYTSPDGITWTLQAPAGAEGGFNGPVIWNGTDYLTFSDGTSAGVYSSPDGVTWNLGASGSQSIGGTHHPVVWNGTGYVAIGTNPLSIYSSPDFAAWSGAFSGTTGPSSKFTSVSFLKGRYLAVGPAASGPQLILESADGLDWHEVNSWTGGQIDSTAYGHGTYVALGDAGTGFTSANAQYWNAMLTPPTDTIASVAFGKGKFVAVGALCVPGPSCSGRVDTSPDGKTWSFQGTSSLSLSDYTSVAYNGSRFVVVTDNSAGDGVYVLTSTDGIAWSAVAFTPPAGTQLTRVHWFKDRFVASGFAPGTQPYVATSTDGLNWKGKLVPQVGYLFSDIAFDGSFYYAVMGDTTNGQVMVSSDARNWSFLGAVPLVPNMQTILSQGGRLITGGSSGQLLAAESKAPTAAGGSFSTRTSTTVSGSLAGSAPGITGAVLTFSIASRPRHGIATIVDPVHGIFSYTPNAGYKGSDSFTFRVSDGVLSSVAAKESITVGSIVSGAVMEVKTPIAPSS